MTTATTETTELQQAAGQQDASVLGPAAGRDDTAPAKAKRRHRRDKQDKPERPARHHDSIDWAAGARNIGLAVTLAIIGLLILADFAYSQIASYHNVVHEAAAIGQAYPQYAPFSYDFVLLALIGVDAVITLKSRPDDRPPNGVRYAVWVFSAALVAMNAAPHWPNWFDMVMGSWSAGVIILFTEVGRNSILRHKLAEERKRKKAERQARKDARRDKWIPVGRWFIEFGQTRSIAFLLLKGEATTYKSARDLQRRRRGALKDASRHFPEHGLDDPAVDVGLADRLRKGWDLTNALKAWKDLIETEDRITVLQRKHDAELSALMTANETLQAALAAERSITDAARAEAEQSITNARQREAEAIHQAKQARDELAEMIDRRKRRDRSRARAKSISPGSNDRSPGSPNPSPAAEPANDYEAAAIRAIKANPSLAQPRMGAQLAKAIGAAPATGTRLHRKFTVETPVIVPGVIEPAGNSD